MAAFSAKSPRSQAGRVKPSAFMERVSLVAFLITAG